MGSGLKAFLITLLCLLVVAGGCGTYYFYNLSKNLKSDKASLQTLVDKLNQDLAAKDKAIQAATTAKKGTSCAAFSAEEKSQIADWKTYENKTYKYTFQYPSDWKVTETSAEMVSAAGTDSGKKITFTAEAKDVETAFSGYKIAGTKTVKVNCEEATENHYNGSSSAALITQSFTKDSNKYLLKFAYTNLGASYSSDVEQIDSLILKTFAF
jgi:hypothetical protein